ncbi:hypothetical protein DAPPUDRAFT_229540, partial [Daphnia pulex]
MWNERSMQITKRSHQLRLPVKLCWRSLQFLSTRICKQSYTGDPYGSCRPIPVIIPPTSPSVVDKPCDPPPCGPNSICKPVGNAPVCSCQPNYLGLPPNCRPECVSSAECPASQACVNFKCRDPCLGTCGRDAECFVVNHSPVCVCPSGWTGDPLTGCRIIPTAIPSPVVEEGTLRPIPPNPCTPNPCGPNSQCQAVSGQAECGCLSNMIGSAPNCRPECILNSDCPASSACVNQKCVDPCPGTCGSNSECRVVNHSPVCSCAAGFTGNAFNDCRPVPVVVEPNVVQPPSPCDPNPCGTNAQCKSQNGAINCVCPANYIGDPFDSCRPECLLNTDCLREKSCVKNRCVDPCQGTCGSNADCRVANHIPVCSCKEAHTGDPYGSCRPIAVIIPPTSPSVIEKPCDPPPCGPHSTCRPVGNAPVCACQPGYLGIPPECRPECVSSSECAPAQACLNFKCQDPCPGTCGRDAQCKIVNHNPICICPAGWTGDPLTGCRIIPTPIPNPVVEEGTLRPIPPNPCTPSPCGPSSQCQVVSGQAQCGCLPNMIGSAPNCRPECLVSSDCPSQSACINQRCIDPCSGTCASNSDCRVVNHSPVCTCAVGYTGNGFTDCRPVPAVVEPNVVQPPTPCDPNPCGTNAQCKTQNGAINCVCPASYIGDPYSSCRPECVLNTDCPRDKNCLQNQCVDPCVGTCGFNADCRVSNHLPVCSCKESHTGDPYGSCRPIPVIIPPTAPSLVEEPCKPSPCGPNSVCRPVGNAPVCSCQPNYLGLPPDCRPECVSSSECAPSQACLNLKCQDPCKETCGREAQCKVVNHNPICVCPSGWTGDPMTGCRIIPTPIPSPSVEEGTLRPIPPNPCTPTPCGPNSQCQVVSGQAQCGCVAGMIGSAPNCRPECVLSSECPSNRACINQKCVDPCLGTCAPNGECRVVNHRPVCSCATGYSGDGFSNCQPIPVVVEPNIVQPPTPCDPNPCGTNAQCKTRNGAIDCSCPGNYVGDPFSSCRPECVLNTDCPRDKSCSRNRCVDPCVGACGDNADCRVANHIPVCSCKEAHTGDPYGSCRPIPVKIPPTSPSVVEKPCDPPPCGPHSTCRPVGNAPVCACQPGYLGIPPECRPECVSSSECAPSQACLNFKCQDPCPGTCGRDAKCQVVNHNPICVCPSGWTGDPLTGCHIIPTPIPNPVVEEGTLRPIPPNPCTPSPCGPSSQCQVVSGQAQCGCLPNMIGSAPNCRPECLVSSDCPSQSACINQKCVDPCPGTCATNADCRVINHSPICNCASGYTGDGFKDCRPMPVVVEPNVVQPPTPCDPNPCGTNAQCKSQNGAINCVCPVNYVGDPFSSCRPECVLNTDCPRDQSCSRNRCIDPCPGTCGINADCRVANHIPVCSCKEAHTGDPYGSCRPLPVKPLPTSPTVVERPCVPTPCGPNSQCREVGNVPACSCQTGYMGVPPECRPECVSSSECSPAQACLNFKCQDPCTGTCGRDADCRVVNHNPICVCPSGWTGDPLTGCSIIPTPILNPVVEEGTLRPIPPNPCTPTPCGPNSQCQVVSGQAQCGCMPNMIGTTPNCRPECILGSDCPSNSACVNQKCVDPCPGTCGSNSECRVLNHSPICSCTAGYTGNAFDNCRPVPAVVEPNVVQPQRPCESHPCGTNAQCKESPGGGINCVCPANYIGDPYSSCRPECVLSSDCPRDRTCSRNRCVDPCAGACGTNSQCRVANHVPVCSCVQGFSGDPYSSCQPIPAESRPIEPVVQEKPCVPSPCGPNSQCRGVGNVPVCSCISGYLGVPPECRPECVTSSECAPMHACVNSKCQNPCLGTCGLNSECKIVNHNPVCTCPSGWTGDPFSQCQIIPTPIPSPTVEEGTLRPIPPNPCNPPPCGSNAQCQAVGGVAQCACLAGMIGSVPNCRPECVISSDCPSKQACVNRKCVDPCPGTCGANAECRVVNHAPSCSCREGFTGNAFADCRPVPAVAEVFMPEQPRPCDSHPCGPNAHCRVNPNSGSAACVCPPDYRGDPYMSCRPECAANSDCPRHRTCLNNRCVDPCAGVCGLESLCRVVNHLPVCGCPQGYMGDPYSLCRPIPVLIAPTTAPSVVEPCNPSPCEVNSRCEVSPSGAPVCVCLPGFTGTAQLGCRPECLSNSECPAGLSCVNRRCRDPCPGLCGNRAECSVASHMPFCNCPPGFTGDPYSSRGCQIIPCKILGFLIEAKSVFFLSEIIFVANSAAVQPPLAEVGTLRPIPPNPCNPPPCGANSVCQVVHNTAQCSCMAGMIGVSPSCRPECVVASDCPARRGCVNQKCVDPCPGTCGTNSDCRVIDHSPVCSCRPGFTGNAYMSCRPIPVVVEPSVVEPTKTGCNPSPCGVNAECRDISGSPECICPPNYIGDPYSSCRPECVLNTDCPRDRTCVRNRCENPCTDACGSNAECRVANHVPVCVCQPGFTGNPFSSCQPTPVVGEPGTIDREDSCNPNPCGTNAECRQQGASGNVCVCLPGLLGDPYVACKPECVTNSDCSNDKACIAQKCKDPCPGACGVNARCQVVGHNPVCSCPNGYTGDPFIRCQPRPAAIETPVVKPECEVDPDCQTTQACVEQRCIDPCLQRPGICAPNAECRVVQHRPVCVCAEGFTGNPQVQCFQGNAFFFHFQFAKTKTVIFLSLVGCRSDSDCPSNEACVNRQCKDPCVFETCGTNALCRVNLHRPQCFCPERHEGDPYRACRQPECLVDDDCPSTLACREKNCRDPCNCPPNTKCTVINHVPRCSCPAGYKGEPNTTKGCFLPEEPAAVKGGCTTDGECPSKHACFNGECVNPCTVIKPCGLNAQCLVIDSLPLRTMTCQCLPGYFGNPNVECRSVPIEDPGCRSDENCPDSQSCRNRQCVSPCAVANPCANNAVCTVTGHQPKCTCPEDFTGNPNINCYQTLPRPARFCQADGDCNNINSCLDSQCQNPCFVANPCPPSADCKPFERQAHCHCPNGTIGNPWNRCDAVPKADVECRSDPECPLDKACEQQVCQDPCVIRNPCGDNAVCRTQQHRPVCFCPDGWGGDPHLKCFRPECEVDDDCPSDRACITGKCLNPCVFGGSQCGTNALCRVTLHRPQCYCPAGMQGNPTVICIPVGCQSHDDCATEEVCDRLNRVCVKVCETIACAPTATCTGKDHQAICDCPPGQRGNPFVRCIEDVPIVTASPPRPECRSDPECPSKEVCISNKCVNPCGVNPCGDTGQLCSVVDSTPLRTVVCQCPPDSFADENSRCISAVTGETQRPVSGCRADDECPSEEACRNGVCESPCDCAPDSICRVVDRKPVCACREGLTGDPLVACYKVGCTVDEECPGTHACVNGQCKPVCSPVTCESGAVCQGINHRPICECPPGTKGNPNAGCKAIGCTNLKDCPTDRACFNGVCTDPCSMPDACAVDQECKPFNHTAVCDCPPGFQGSPQTACTRVDIELGCRADTDCPSLEACINRECKDPCEALKPCAPSAVCEVKPTSPYRTMVCVCPPGTTGYAAIECVKVAVPEVEEECEVTEGFIKMPNGTCVCDPLRNLVPGPNGTCICDPEKGLIAGPSGVCVSPVLLPECVSNDDCPDDKYCNTTCRDPCAERVCYPNSECRATEHRAVCACIRGHAYKDEESGCVPEPPPFRTDFPRPDIVVNCLADGVQVDIHIGTAGFDGVLYVKGHSKDENCRRVLDAKRDVGSIDYKVRFDTCGLVLENGEASFILVIQKHPKLMTFKAQAYQVRCVYDTPEKTVTVGFNVSMLTTAGTISNTGPPPVCTMKICLPSGQEVRSAVIGDTLMLKVEVQPIGIYGGFARSCYAVTDNNNTHLVTDENGCPTDPTIFGAWTQHP